jgi:hypothetical protein
VSIAIVVGQSIRSDPPDEYTDWRIAKRDSFLQIGQWFIGHYDPMCLTAIVDESNIESCNSITRRFCATAGQRF